ncbi:MAG: hypothetical protein ACM3PE_00100 [Deltaproteobacteria bacterium]
MDTSQVSLTRTMLNISTPNNQGVNFSQGEVVKGVVQEVRSDGTVMITIKGQTIEALTEVPVQPGQQLYLKVDDFRDGKTFLKVVTPQAMEVIENANLSANLVEMGISAKEENVAMARKLLEYNMPVTTSNLNEMAKGVKLLGAATPRNLEMVAFVMSRNLPVDMNTLKALEQYTLPGSNIAKLLESVVQSLRELGQTQSAAMPASPELLLADVTDSTGTGGKTPVAAAANADTPALSGASSSSGGNTGVTSSSGQILNEAASFQPSQAASPGPAASGQAVVPSVELSPAQQGSPATAVSGNISAPIPDFEPNVTMAVLEESDPVPSVGRTAPNTTPVNSGINQGAQQTTELPQPAAQAPSTNNVSQPAVTAGPVLPETSAAELAAQVNTNLVPDQGTAKAFPPQAAGQVPVTAVTVEDGNQEPVIPAPPAASIDLPEEIPANTRVSPDITGSSNGKTTAVLPGQNVPAAVIASDMTELEFPAGLAVKAAETEAEAAPQAPAATGSKAQDSTASAIADKSTPGTAGDSSKSAAPLQSDIQKGADRPGVQTFSSTGPNASIAAGTGKINDQLNLLKTLIEWMQVDGREPAADISGKLERAVASDKDVIRGLTMLQDAIKNENTQTRSPVVHDLLQRIDNLEKELSGQKMFNFLSRTTNDNQFNFYYFSIPVRVGEELHQCQLRFNKDGRRDLRDVDNLNFVVSLDTGKMGLVLFHVNWQRSGRLTLQGVVENDNVAKYLSNNMPNLVSKLKDLGYSVQNLGIKVSKEEIDEGLKVRMEETPLSIRPLGIDITV